MAGLHPVCCRGGAARWAGWGSLLAVAALLCFATERNAAAEGLFPLGEIDETTTLPETPKPHLGVGELPPRPPMLLEIGDRFLDTGQLLEGFEIPGGAVWQPRLWVFGTARSAIQSYDNGITPEVSEFVNRLDLFANLQLTGTERLVVGFRPLDKDRSGKFTGYQFEPKARRGWLDETNANIQTLFFEGDFGSLFPFLDREGILPVDFGFSVGRQPLFFQNGIFINDRVDAVGLVRNNISVADTTNVRVTGVYGWNLHRTNNIEDNDAQMVALFTSTDTDVATFDLDMAYVDAKPVDGGDAVYFGGAMIRRFGLINSAIRINSSFATGHENNVSTNGALISGEFSTNYPHSHDIVYFDPFISFGNYTQVAKDPVVGGPLAPLGINFAGFGIGTNRSALSNTADDVVGFALGYQAFWDNRRRNLTLEIAGRKDTEHKDSADGIAFGAQFQQAIGQRLLLTLNAWYAPLFYSDESTGVRAELLFQF